MLTFKKAMLYGGIIYGGMTFYYCYNYNEHFSLYVKNSKV